MKYFILTIYLLFLTTGVVKAQSPEAVLQKEQIRRQEITLRATQMLEQANKLIESGETDKGEALLKQTLSEIPESGKGADIHLRGKYVLSNLETQRAMAAAKEGKWFDAKDAGLRALALAPDNTDAQAIVQNANKKLGTTSDGEINPAVDRKFVRNLNDIREMYDEAVDYENTGQFDQSIVLLHKILKTDPYNKQAAKLLKGINTKRLRISDQERLMIREQMLTETRENWTEQLDIKVEKLNEGGPIVPLQKSNEFAIQEKLRNTIIPQIQITDGTINDAVRFLTAKSRELDPEGTGVSFLLKNEKVLEQSKPFTLSLSNIPIDEALRYITNLAGVKYKVEEFAVFIVPLSEPDDVFITREFPVRATFFEIETDETATDTSRTTRRRTRVQPTSGESKDTIRQALVARGVQFLDGATAIYNQATGILTVRNTQDQIDLIEELVTDDQGESLMVKVEAKFVEINQTDLDELTPQFNLQGSYTPVPGTRNFNVSAASVSIGNGLNGSTNVKTADGINQFLNIDPSVGNAAAPQSITVNPNQVGITGALDGNRFATLINLISQKTSSDVMTAPSIIVNDGAQASINVSREFSYPTEYDPPDIQSSIGFSSLLVGFAGAGAGGITSTSTDVETSRITVVPSFPTDFEERNVGVTMTVKPQVTVDRQRVYLTMQPELVEFDGFINYGSPVLDPIGDGSSTNVVATNEVRQPVFSTRTVKNAQLEIKDGYTMVLGGLIREDISTVEEKVPFLGDLPFVGRAFRSNAEQSVKRNLLIFVTVRILRPDGEPYNANAGVNAIATASAP